MEAALAALSLQDKPNYTATAKIHGVGRDALSRRHRGVQVSAAEKATNQCLLQPAQERSLIQHINRLTELGIPPTVAMVRNFAGEITRKDVGKSWAQRFVDRHKDVLMSRHLTGIDKQRVRADNKESYNVYFELLKRQIEQYAITPSNTYNIDEKGFLIGFITKARRVFSKQAFNSKKLLGALQDGSREWITILGAICADGTSLPPMLIYKALSGHLQSSWVQDFKSSDNDAFFACSASGWTNDELALQWIEQVFDRCTKDKARQGRDWRLLFVDGHGSHVTVKFLDYCYKHRIIVAVYPPHSTHRLQPLDVGCFSPLAVQYSKQLDRYIHDSEGISSVSKRDFFRLFWPAYKDSFNEHNILSAFSKTGIHPFNPNVILKTFKSPAQSRPASSGKSSVISATDERKIKRLLKEAIAELIEGDTGAKTAKMSDTVTFVSAQCSIYKHQVETLQRALYNERKKRTRGKQLIEEYRAEQGTAALIFSPTKIDRLKELQSEREERKAADKAAKQDVLQQRQMAKQSRRVAVAQRKLEREEQRQKRQLEAVVKATAKRHQKETAEANRQLVFDLHVSAKKPKEPVKRSLDRPVPPLLIQPPELAVVPKVAATTRSRTIRRPQRYEGAV